MKIVETITAYRELRAAIVRYDELLTAHGRSRGKIGQFVSAEILDQAFHRMLDAVARTTELDPVASEGHPLEVGEFQADP